MEYGPYNLYAQIEKELSKTEKRIFRIYLKKPEAIHSDEMVLVMLWQQDGLRTWQDVINHRVTSFKTIDRACRSVRQAMGIKSRKREEMALQYRTFLAGRKVYL